MTAKYTILALLFLALLWGCNGDTEKRNAELLAKNNELTKEMQSREEYIDSVTQAINDVYANIEAARTKENLVLKETNEIETKKKLTKQEVRNRLLEEISLIDSTLRGSHKRIDNLQSKVDSYKTQFAGLRKMVSTMKRTVEEREQSIAALEQRVRSLETEVAEKDRMITERDSTIQVQTSTIDQQHKQLTTAYYIVGSRSDLEKKGIIKKEGGFLWGLLGSTTMLANGINMDYFTPIAKNEQTTIDVVGNIDEIIPKRNEHFYSKLEVGNNQSALKITEPQSFWQDPYLVIITD